MSRRKSPVSVPVQVISMSFIPDHDTAREIVKGRNTNRQGYFVSPGTQYVPGTCRVVRLVNELGGDACIYVFCLGAVNG